eukprot:TCONS_00031181-protein
MQCKAILQNVNKSFSKLNILRRSLASSSTHGVYHDYFKTSIESPEEFWDERAQNVNWFEKYTQVLDHTNPPFTKWFINGKMNTCYEMIDRHVDEGHGDQVGLIYDSPVTDSKQKLTYKQLQEEIGKFARVLINQGVQKGDRVVIYMPMIPEAMIALHACSRIGAIHVAVFGGFASNELARRIDHCHPKVIVTASCGIEPKKLIKYEPLIQKAMELSTHKPKKIITVNREMHRNLHFDKDVDLDWHEAMDKAQHPHSYVPVDANDPLYILYTSGTTGVPKGIVRPCGGHAVALRWSMKNSFDVSPGEVFWAASDIGWIVGHSYMIYAPFLNRSPSVVFEGKPVGSPDASTFFRMIEEYQVKGLLTAPTTIRVIENEDPDGLFSKKYDLSSLDHIFVAGENADDALLQWATKTFRAPVVDHWWQTESGWPITNHHVGMGMSIENPATCGKPTPGFNVKVLKEDLSETSPGELGHVHVELPLPPGAMMTIWNDDERFKTAYFSKEGYYDTSDAGFMDADGYLKIGGRIDDIINVAGHRLSTKQIETAIEEHDEIAESAVIGMRDDLKGLMPCGLVVKSSRCTKTDDEMRAELIELVRHDVGPVAAFKRVVFVPFLPKTRSAKIVRGTLKKILDGDEFKIPQTVDNPDDFHIIVDILQAQKFE